MLDFALARPASRPFRGASWARPSLLVTPFVILLLLVVAPAFAVAQDQGAQDGLTGDGMNCFALAAGKDATADGSVLFGHNEDTGAEPAINHWRVPRRKHPKGATVRLVRGGVVPQVAETWSYIWSQMPGFHYSDAYFNEHGVAVASNACSSREDKPELKSGGIGYMLRRLVAERATSARHGVQVATRLLGEFGYAAPGRTLTIADAKEAWILCMVRGKTWAAARVPDDKVIVLANSYPLHRVDPNDTENFAVSPGLIDYAEARGWYDASRGDAFDFTVAFSAPRNRMNPRNYRRQWRGISLLAKNVVDEDWRLPTFFTPSRKLTPRHFMRVLRDHYEDTVYDVTDGYQKGTPNATTERTICTSSTINSTVFQLRGHLPVDVGSLMWISMRRPDGSVYVPWYCGIEDVPPMFALGRAKDALATHFAKGATKRPQPPSFAAFAELCRRLEANYREVFPQVRRMRSILEASFFELQPTIEATAAELHSKDPELARDFLTSYTIGQTGKTIRAINRLCERLSTTPAR